MNSEPDANTQPQKQSLSYKSLPSQSSPQDTSNWDDRAFTAPSGVDAQQNSTVKQTRKKRRNLIMAPNDDAWVKRNRKRLEATNPEWLKQYYQNQKSAEPISDVKDKPTE